MNWPPPGSVPTTLLQLHQTYCQLTGQTLSLGFDRERLWFEFHRTGFTQADLIQVVRYLQKEIRHTRRNVGALKLSNLLQLDRFEEDLNISRVRLTAPPPPKTPGRPPAANLLTGRTGARPTTRIGATAPTQRNPSLKSLCHWTFPSSKSLKSLTASSPKRWAERLNSATAASIRLSLVLELSIKRAQRSPQMRLRLPPDRRQEAFLF